VGWAALVAGMRALHGDVTAVGTGRYQPRRHMRADGSRLVYSATGNRAGKTALETALLKPTSQVDGMPPLSFFANWTIDQNGVYFYPAQSPKTLSYFDFATKKVRSIYELRNDSYEVGTSPSIGVSISPDGRYILYAAAEVLNTDIMLVEHFH